MDSGGRGRRMVAGGIVVVTAGLLAVGLALAVPDGDLAQAVPGTAALLFSITGGLIVVRRPGNRVGWLLCGIGLLTAVNGAASEYARHAYLVAPGSLPGRAVAASLLTWTPIPLIGVAAALLPLLFPDGRPVSPRWRVAVWTAYGYIVLATVGNGLDPGSLEGVGAVRNPSGVPALLPLTRILIIASAPCLVVAVLGGMASLVVRWRRARGDERQQVKWFVAGFVPLLVPIAVHEQAQRFSEVAFPVALALIPVAIGVAVLRYRLYELDVLINRTLVYAALTGLVAGGYVTVVVIVESVLGAGHGRWAQASAAVAAALALMPLRSRIQWLVDRLLYGDRLTPYDALTRLGRMLERAPVPETVLQSAVTTIADALRVPYAAIELRQGELWQPAAVSGRAGNDEPEVYPMVYQDEIVGRLLVGRRTGGDDFTGADRRLLADLARQAGVAAHAVQLTVALQRSRAGLVTAREEERRRLRRDLHDGLGPALAGVTLGLHAARANLIRDPQRSDALLGALAGQVDDAVSEIRRLVYGLRPPALDELGLTGALKLYASRLESGPDGLAVAFDLPPAGLGELPAAVEAAAYRIVTEALTNVARHADARGCQVRLAVGDGLDIEVRDDGTGIDGQPAGVGITAMRERAAELGGQLSIESPGTGTRVRARLPLVSPA